MNSWNDFWTFFVANWHLINIPFIAGLIGWSTNILALKMTFYPLEFKGIDIEGIRTIGWKLPPLGWQGIIPSRADKMASKSVDLITTKLIDIKDQFDKINPKAVAQDMSPALSLLMRNSLDKTLSEEIPLWKLYSLQRKEALYAKADESIPVVIADIMKDVKEDINEFLDIKHMAIHQLTTNKALLNQIFQKVGHKEFKFIEYSGAYFGFLFGLVQMFIFIYYQALWQLPVGGLIVGYLTNGLALKIIFEPYKPKRFLFFTFQGLFIKRQKEVAKEYAHIIAEQIMTMPNIADAIFNGAGREKLNAIVAAHIDKHFDQAAGFSSSLIKITSGTKAYDNVKAKLAAEIIAEMPKHIDLIFDYTKQALDIENTLYRKMSNLPPDEFVGFLRPVFQEDELKLLIVGAILGMAAGFLQIFIV